jgi:8-oxo-dGTP pyrophosphatase MutT (NUDIX family)
LSPFRPDLVEIWMFRGRPAARPAARPAQARPVAPPDEPASAAGPADIEILLLRRSPGRILPGLWQCVSGSLEDGENVTEGALRELVEETGFGAQEIVGFYDLDQVNQFHEPSVRDIRGAADGRRGAGPFPRTRRDALGIGRRGAGPGHLARLSRVRPSHRRESPRSGPGNLVRADAWRRAGPTLEIRGAKCPFRPSGASYLM